MKKQEPFIRLLLLAIIAQLIASIIAQFSGYVSEDDPVLYYTDWLRYLDESMVQIPPDKRVAGIQIPLDIEIVKPATTEHCEPEKGPYCYSLALPELEFDSVSPCANGGIFYECLNSNCSNPVQPFDLNSFSSNLTFFVNEVDAPEREVETSSECGLEVTADSLNFSAAASSCTLLERQPTARINISDLAGGSTMTFTVRKPASGSFLRIDGLTDEFGRNMVTELSIYLANDSVSNSTVWSSQSIPIVEHFKPLKLGEFAILFKSNGWAIFSEGELAMTVDISSSSPLIQLTVGLGSDNFTGDIKDIQFYTTAIDSNQLYSMFSGEPLAKYLYLPECRCPSEYFDTFGLVKDPFYPNTCVDGSQISFLPRLERYSDYNGKWGAFEGSGWISDFTDEAELLVKLPQQMSVYAIGGSFYNEYGYKFPSAIEVEIVGLDSQTRAQVFVSKNCTGDYGLPVTPIPLEVVQVMLPSRRKRSTDQPLPPKCYKLEDFISLSEDFNELSSDFTIPILGPGEEDYQLSDSLVGDVRIKLIGHEGINGPNENWYQLSGLSLHARPHCGGNNYTLLGAPATMSEYYNFHKPETKAYTCHCPEGITGEMCESCEETAGVYRYFKDTNVCANCDCSDLTRNSNKRCDSLSGQCDCGAQADLEFTGRQCHWYVSDVNPLYGPNAGGTKIIAQVGYLDYDLDFEVTINDFPVDYNISQK
ncbi:uncharacterized protein [Watersipora subatra]|uniref:uncharacterized protein n=1 Tax=Watersipora subatra TaxID=2589382 RepID=UPI00355AFC06